MTKHSVEVPRSDPYSYVAELSGPAVLDRIKEGFGAEQPTTDGLFPGSIRSAEVTHHGSGVDSISRYVPGFDHPLRIDARTTIASGIPMARKVSDEIAIPQLSIIADLPERTTANTGQYTLRTLGRFGLAYSLLLAEQAAANVSVVVGDDSGAKTIFRGSSESGFMAMRKMDKVLQHGTGTVPSKDKDNESPLFCALKAQTANVDPETDTVLVISDFMAGYDNDDNTFDWADALTRLQARLQDRLVTIRLKSPAQRLLPAGVLRGLSVRSVEEIRQNYADKADIKADAIEHSLRRVRSLEVDASVVSPHPVMAISKFLSSKPKK